VVKTCVNYITIYHLLLIYSDCQLYNKNCLKWKLDQTEICIHWNISPVARIQNINQCKITFMNGKEKANLHRKIVCLNIYNFVSSISFCFVLCFPKFTRKKHSYYKWKIIMPDCQQNMCRRGLLKTWKRKLKMYSSLKQFNVNIWHDFLPYDFDHKYIKHVLCFMQN
jgi:hypothetical protein